MVGAVGVKHEFNGRFFTFIPASTCNTLAQDRTLVTIDSDFSHVVRFPPENTPEVIWLRPWPPTETMIERLFDGVLRLLDGTAYWASSSWWSPGRIRIC